MAFQKKFKSKRRFRPHPALFGLLVVGLLAAYWLLPIKGRLLILTDSSQNYLGVWPQVKIDQSAARPGDPVIISLSNPTFWDSVRLYIDDKEAQLLDAPVASIGGVFSWRWRFTAPQSQSYTAVFYRDCYTGCVEGMRVELGMPTIKANTGTSSASLKPTKLGVVFADETRDWHGKAGWDVDLLYTRQPDASDFGIDSVARRLKQAQQQGLRMLVRLAYDRGQALPPTGDEAALASYLEYCARLARDERLSGVYGYVIGSGFNRKSENSLSPDRLTTPEWYARVFSGYGLIPGRTDNVVQTMRTINPRLRILAGPVTPWVNDQSGALKDSTDTAWLNYMNTLVARLDETALAKQVAGVSLVGPDGFGVQASGRPEAPEVAGHPALEPSTDLFRTESRKAQMGFRVYRDWLRIINTYSTTRNLPVYITSANTFTSDTQIDPDQNYPAGWLSAALAEISKESQVQALCWFVDSPYDKWASFSLKSRLRSLDEAATEFDRLLQQPSAF